jgi:MFS family permease
MGASVCLPFINAYYTQKEISPFEIGILGAIGPIMAFAVQPIWARISDRTGKRRLVLQLITLVSAAAFLLYLVGETFPVFCIATIILMAFNSAMMPLNDAIITNVAM